MGLSECSQGSSSSCFYYQAAAYYGGSVPSNALIDFYAGQRPDHRGRLLSEIQSWDFEQLEDIHDFIQWLFPLPEPSPVNPGAPTLDIATIEEFRQRPDLQAALLASFRTMLAFYGFELASETPPKIERGANFAVRSTNWLNPNNHNHLRITRILRALRLLGLEAHAHAFFEALDAVYKQMPSKITATSYGFWQRA
jgi:hypothetical protein